MNNPFTDIRLRHNRFSSAASTYDPKIPHTYIWIYAFLLMLFCAGSSPLIEMLSPDSNIFFTMGRAAADGQILYQDIADHKGFYLFFINWLGAFLSKDNMLGLFLVEILFAALKITFLYKISFLYTKNKRSSLLTSFLFMAAATNYFSWNTGNLGEHFALLFQLISCYYIALYLEQNNNENAVGSHPPLFMFLHGLCATVVLFIQANFIAMWIPFGLWLAIVLLKNGYIKNFFINLLSLLSGVLLAVLPGLLYGIKNKCLEDMYFIMFEVNFLYAADGRKGVNILSFLKDFIFSPSFAIVILAVVGAVTASLFYKKLSFTLLYVGMFLFTLLCMNVSLNANPIYYTMYMPFMLPFFLWAAHRVNRQTENLPLTCFPAKASASLFLFITAGILSCSVVCNLQLVKKYFAMGTSVHAYESARAMDALIVDKESKVLVLGESLYYNATNTLPHIRYFTIFGSGLKYETFPYCIDEQFTSLLSGENEYVIVQYKSEGYDFWNRDTMDPETQKKLKEDYDLLYEYSEGGIHAALYQKK